MQLKKHVAGLMLIALSLSMLSVVNTGTGICIGSICSDDPLEPFVRVRANRQYYSGDRPTIEITISRADLDTTAELQRKFGSSWITIGTVPSRMGTYYVTDTVSHSAGTVEYRLKYRSSGYKYAYGTITIGKVAALLIHGFLAGPTFMSAIKYRIDDLYDEMFVADYYDSINKVSLRCDGFWDILILDRDCIGDIASYHADIDQPIGPGSYYDKDSKSVKYVGTGDNNLARRVYYDTLYPSLRTYPYRIDIVAHSMGGLVGRALIQHYLHPSGGRFTAGGYSHELRNFVTLGTPHRGLDIDDDEGGWLGRLVDTINDFFSGSNVVPRSVEMLDRTVPAGIWVNSLETSWSNVKTYTIAGVKSEAAYEDYKLIDVLGDYTPIKELEREVSDGEIPLSSAAGLPGVVGHKNFYVNHASLRENYKVLAFLYQLLASKLQTVSKNVFYQIRYVDYNINSLIYHFIKLYLEGTEIYSLGNGNSEISPSIKYETPNTVSSFMLKVPVAADSIYLPVQLFVGINNKFRVPEYFVLPNSYHFRLVQANLGMDVFYDFDQMYLSVDATWNIYKYQDSRVVDTSWSITIGFTILV